MSEDAIIQILTLVFSFLGPIILLFARAKIVGQFEKANEEAAKTSISVEKAHVAINSERTHMQFELKRMNEIVLALTEDKAKRDQARVDRHKDAAEIAAREITTLATKTAAELVEFTKKK